MKNNYESDAAARAAVRTPGGVGGHQPAGLVRAGRRPADGVRSTPRCPWAAFYAACTAAYYAARRGSMSRRQRLA